MVLRLGFIGFGRMASALYQAMIPVQQEKAYHVVFVESDQARREQVERNYGIQAVSLSDLFNSSDIVFCCVKPNQVRDVILSSLPVDQLLFISICAGVPVAFFESVLGENVPIIRAMPNTPIAIGQGMTAFYANQVASSIHLDQISSLFSSCGQLLQVSQESDLDTVTGVSGSGPAFLYSLADSIAQYAESQGLPYRDAIQLIAQTMIGSGHMLLCSKYSPPELIAEVTSPNGTTAAGLAVFDQLSIGSHIQSVINEAVLRSKELSVL